MLTFPVPASLSGDALSDELSAAGFDADVFVRGDELVVDGPADADRDAVRAVIDAHVPPEPGPSRDERLADLRTKAEALPQNNPARPLLLGLIDLA